MNRSVVSRTARLNGGRARGCRPWLANRHPSSVPPTTRQKTKRKPHSTRGSNGAPTRVRLGGPRNGRLHVLLLAPAAKRTARLPRSTSRRSQMPPPRQGNARTPLTLGTWFPCRSGPTLSRRCQRRVVLVRLSTASLGLRPRCGAHRRCEQERSCQERIVPDACPPASRQIRANIRSVGVVRLRNLPVRGQAAAASRIEEFATPSVSGLSDWQRESQALQQEHAQHLARNSVLWSYWRVGQHDACVVARMRARVGPA